MFVATVPAAEDNESFQGPGGPIVADPMTTDPMTTDLMVADPMVADSSPPPLLIVSNQGGGTLLQTGVTSMSAGAETGQPEAGPEQPGSPEGAPQGRGTEPADPLAAWLASPAGRYLLAWQHEQLASLLADRFGYYAVQLGWPQVQALEANRMPSRLRIGLAGQPGDILVERFDELPFDSQSVDLVVVVHQLETSPQPHRMLREIDRILRPEGLVVVTGFNPMSLWGLRHHWGSSRLASVIGPDGHMIGVPRLRDWCKLLGLEVGVASYGLHAPMCRSTKGFERVRFLDRAGERWWPILGAAYVITAIKRVRGMRLIGPCWRKSVSAPSPAVAVSNRTMERRVLSAPMVAGMAGKGPRESAVVLPLRRRPSPRAAGKC